MLENSVWKQYHKDTTMQEVLSKFYAVDAAIIMDDEQELYALLKRKLTKNYKKISHWFRRPEKHRFITQDPGCRQIISRHGQGYIERPIPVDLF